MISFNRQYADLFDIVIRVFAATSLMAMLFTYLSNKVNTQKYLYEILKYSTNVKIKPITLFDTLFGKTLDNKIDQN